MSRKTIVYTGIHGRGVLGVASERKDAKSAKAARVFNAHGLASRSWRSLGLCAHSIWQERSLIRVMTIALFACAILSGCRRSSAPGGGSAKPVEVRLGYFANLTHAQVVLGISSGEFEKAIAPNHLTTKVFNAGPSLVEALFAGEIDIGYIGPGPALSAFERSKGKGIRVIAGAAANGVVIVAAPNSGINTMHDLKDKRIATPQMGNTQDISARHYMLAELHSEDANNVQAIPNAEQLAMMSRGQIDAAWAPEPWGARLEAEAGGKIIA